MHSGCCKTIKVQIPQLPTGPPKTPLDDSCWVPRPQVHPPSPRPGMKPLPQAVSRRSSMPVRVAGMPRDTGEQDQSCAVFSRANPNFHHLQHIWAAVSQGLKQQLSLSMGEHSRNNPMRFPRRSSLVVTCAWGSLAHGHCPPAHPRHGSDILQTPHPGSCPAARSLPPLPAAKTLHCTN